MVNVSSEFIKKIYNQGYIYDDREQQHLIIAFFFVPLSSDRPVINCTINDDFNF